MKKTKKEGQTCKNCVVKTKGHTEEFDEKKVYGSVYAACASVHYNEEQCEKTADDMTKKIKKFTKGKKKIESTEIRRRIEKELRKKDEELAFFYEQHLPNLKRL
ncbi:MAG: ATP cone domain-containing protein [Flavobacteriales bacterium]|jgi:transcriptional regulator NrdR family protein|nr:ATP cone domain-containing protein [Flavobacteriales bacterium]|tara:strand:+ start:851 stop:1162 length:312 start_codon:yes stop_codon:yes gene_type:complete